MRTSLEKSCQKSDSISKNSVLSRSLLLEFTFKLLTNYFLYGYLCLFGIGILNGKYFNRKHGFLGILRQTNRQISGEIFYNFGLQAFFLESSPVLSMFKTDNRQPYSRFIRKYGFFL